jgi:hypothetical protein
VKYIFVGAAIGFRCWTMILGCMDAFLESCLRMVSFSFWISAHLFIFLNFLEYVFYFFNIFDFSYAWFYFGVQIFLNIWLAQWKNKTQFKSYSTIPLLSLVSTEWREYIAAPKWQRGWTIGVPGIPRTWKAAYHHHLPGPGFITYRQHTTIIYFYSCRPVHF